MEFHKYTSIKSFAHLIKKVRRYGLGQRDYIIKIKLHGTNAAIVKEGGVLHAQSRNRVITPDNDNAGFAQYVSTLDPMVFTEGAVVYGEWAGPGVQKGDAVCKIPQKTFFVFAVKDKFGVVSSDLDALKFFVPEVPQIMVLPKMGDLSFDPYNDIEVDKVAEELSELAESIGKRDPYIAEVFGVEGSGEGIVLSLADATEEDYSNFICKVKCAGHRVKAGKAAAVRKLEIPSDVKSFCDMFVTDARVKQGISEVCNGVATFKDIPDFAKWFGSDVKKESVEELLSADLTWKDVSKEVNRQSILLFKGFCK